MKSSGELLPEKIHLIANSKGEVRELPGFSALAQNGSCLKEPEPHEVIPLPEGAHLYLLPDRIPLARKKGGIVPTTGIPVAAILPQGYTRTLIPAYEPRKKNSWLPYFGYTACFFQSETIYVAALNTQADPKWDPQSFKQPLLNKKIKQKLAGSPHNRVLRQLAKCAQDYRCYTAANVFLERWEGALPVSPSCNSVCRGCISKAEDPGPPSPQDRFEFVPSLEECTEVIRSHFEKAPEPIISFGQGCEGEPSLQTPLIEKLLHLKAGYPQGQFHINTNGSKPKLMEKLFKAGMDSIRVSLNSVQPQWYDRYYRPKNYQFKDVIETLRIAKAYGVYASLNLLCFPGVTDHPRETDLFLQFLEKLKPDLIQLRNLNIDPWLYLKECIQEEVSGIGMSQWIGDVQNAFPKIKIGNFTPYIKHA